MRANTIKIRMTGPCFGKHDYGHYDRFGNGYGKMIYKKTPTRKIANIIMEQVREKGFSEIISVLGMNVPNPAYDEYEFTVAVK